MILTSGYNLENYDIVSYIGYESAKVVIGTGVFSTLDASVSDFLGVRSNAYEDKLNLAEKEAQDQLIKKAESIGGNAIIGIDVDYATFSADLMGVIVSGTVVKAEKSEKETLKTETKRIYNMEYNTSIPLRILDSLFLYENDTGKLFISLFGKSYDSHALKGVEVKVIIETLFRDKMEIPNIAFGDICINKENEISTEYCNLRLERDIFKIIKNVSVRIMKYVTDQDEVVEVSAEQSRIIDVTKEQLMNLRKFYGKDAVNRAYKNDTGWVCYCGAENFGDEQVCKLCKRELHSNESMQMNANGYADTFFLEGHIDTINGLKDAKEIYTYLVETNCSDNYFQTTVLPEIKKFTDYERMYGSMKSSVIEKLEELYTDS